MASPVSKFIIVTTAVLFVSLKIRSTVFPQVKASAGQGGGRER
ncbi:hypothetical protein M108_0360 [Bacteroides fragilis str. 3397 T14]|nr:hypothetical protein M108_0360 [Bacteroides fragilis str. 3397 T14]